jgi:predicted membrane protein DUF2339
MTPESDPPAAPADLPLEARVERLEQSIVRLSAEVAAIRAQITGAGAPGHPPSAAQSRAALHRTLSATAPPSVPPRITTGRYLGESLDLERLLGRYGMLGIAVLAAAAAVGTFLSWAVSHGYLTLPPRARIVVGLAFAAGIAVWGMRLRRTERSFGSSLLGLALVIVLVCAYAAGPGLAVVPEWFAFVGAMAVSWALAVFAHAEDDEPLWCVAFAGAAITPFVTSSGKENLYGLVAYAASTLIAACFAVGARPWVIAWRVFYAASALLAVAGVVASRGHGLAGFLVAFGLPVIAAIGGVLPFTPNSRKRAALRWLWMLAVVAGFVAPSGRGVALFVGSTFLAAAALWLAIADRLDAIEQSSLFAANRDRIALLDWIDAAVIPLALCVQAAGAFEPAAPKTVGYGIGAAIFIAFAWRRSASVTRDAAVCGFLLTLAAGLNALHLETPTGVVLAVIVIALGSLVLHRARPSTTWVVGSAVALLLAAGTSATALLDHPAYTQPPFSTEASFTALCVTIALGLVARFRAQLADAMTIARSGRAAPRHASDRELGSTIVVAAPWAWAFVWGYLELSMAFSRSTSTLLLVVYFAACAVAGVAIGHTRGSAATRKAGLGLALLAAATAVYGASSFFAVGVRVLAYLVTSAFLLGIAYWYRRPGQMNGIAADAAAPPELS